MPFPWKKNRVTRISQIVADLQSPKRGGSLVVETGFPTSLIDLFVKNRSRFKKHRSKKPVQPDISDPPPPPPSPVTPPPTMTDPQALTVSHSEVLIPSSEIEGNVNEAAVPVRVGECGSGSGLNMVIAKILIVMVLVASVKRLTVGITVSAFALLFLEYAGNRVVSCPNVKFLSQRVFACVWFQRFLQLKAETEPVQVGGVELGSEALSIDEIEVVEARSEVGICGELDWGCEKWSENGSSKGKVLEPCPCEVSECKIRGSRSGRFKSKMVKKLVPKKFRSSSKKEKKEKGSKHDEGESGSEISSAVGEDKLPILEIEEVLEDDGKEEDENGDKTIKTKLECVRDGVVDSGITCSRESSQLAKNKKGNSGSIILVIIALVGLLAGRFQALILSMTWCCMLKLVRGLWRSKNVPLIKCSGSNS
ncbi:hypothetical protein VNO77_25519 [Canavalia gladiata]|uniref:Uncharacterized protein n=1 Tax=Canavalia gladiata TaxID=3824 RepID=A0AAN9LAR9_CANGL